MFSSPFLFLPAGLEIATAALRDALLVVQVVPTKKDRAVRSVSSTHVAQHLIAEKESDLWIIPFDRLSRKIKRLL